MDFSLRGISRVAIATSVICVTFFPAFAREATDDAEARNQESWREAIVRSEAPSEGCFQASYPSLAWSKIECAVAPDIPFEPRSGRPSGQSVGNGNDYAADVTTGLINRTIGSFAKVKGVKTETGRLGANDYTLQLNSNFMNTAACDHAQNPGQCKTWQQFIYSSGYQVAFMQYWLINYNNPCPSGWLSKSTNCYSNSAAVTVSQELITKLKTLKLSGSAKNGGMDTLVFTVGTQAYSTTGLDSVVNLATAWTQSEFNILGDGNSSEATFNSGSSLTVKVQVSNGTKNAPICASGAGTSGETNNLSLGNCSGTGGAKPHIEFDEYTQQKTYSVTTFDFDPSHPYATFATDISDNGQIVGAYSPNSIGPPCSSPNAYTCGFFGTIGSFTSFSFGPGIYTSIQGINNAGQMVGMEGNSAFFGETTVGYPGAQNTEFTGINNLGDIVGDYYGTDSRSHGFLYRGGQFTLINYPGATATQIYKINDLKQVTGYSDVAGPFIYDLTSGSFTTVNPNGGIALGINSHDQVVGGDYLGCYVAEGGAITRIATNLGNCIAFGINSLGQIVGRYEDANGLFHGFLAVPQ